MIIVTCMLILLPTTLSVTGQTVDSDPVADCSIARKPAEPKVSTISAGVLNGRAVRLVRPEFPATALAVGAQGQVQVSVLIDEYGCIVEANAVSGHPLLISASIRAARRSAFLPTLLSGKPVRVYGSIVYNYLRNQMNWLELGFRSDTIETLRKYLPTGFDRERTLIEGSNDPDLDEKKQEILEQVLGSIQSELVSDPKSLWLFTVGRELGGLSRYPWRSHGREAKLEELQRLVDSCPDGAFAPLKGRLVELINEPDDAQFWTRLNDLEDRLFGLAT